MSGETITFSEREISASLIERTVGDAVIFRPQVWPTNSTDYFRFLLQRFTHCLHGRSGAFYIHCGQEADVYNLGRHVRSVFVQLEHTLVLPGGRDHFDAPLGNIVWNEQRYLVRLYREFWERNDFIVEYSIPNILNLESLEELKARFRKKVIYVPPLVFPCEHGPARQPRPNAIVTTFVDATQPRRAQLLRRLEEQKIPAQRD